MLGLQGHLQYLVDPAHRHTAAEVFALPDDAFVAAPPNTLTRSHWWVRFRVRAADDGDWTLRARFPRPLVLRAFAKRDGVVVLTGETGLRIPRDQRFRPDDDEHTLRLRPDDGVIVLEADMQPSRLNLDVATDATWAGYRARRSLVDGLYYGIFVGLLFFNLFFGLWIKDVAHLLYVPFIICMALHIAVRDGWLPEDVPTAVFQRGAGLPITSLATLIFTRRFLRIERDSHPRLFAVVVIGLALGIAASLPPFFGVTTSRLGALVTLFNIVVVIACAVVPAARGDLGARLFLLAWASLIASVVASILNALGVIHAEWVNEGALRLGAAAEMILLSLALAARVRTLREAKEAVERRLHDERLAQQSALARSTLEAAEAERARTARELHDGVGHALLLLKQRAGVDAPTLQADLQAVLDDVRASARALMPSRLRTEGLAEALRSLADEHTAATGADVDVVMSPAGEAALNGIGDVGIHVYRVVQEALSNASRHGQADHVRIDVDLVEGAAQQLIELTVRDNGRGLGDGASGLGALALEQRASILGGSAWRRDRGDQGPGRARRGVEVGLRFPVPGPQ